MNTNFKDMIQLSKRLFPAATFFLTKFQKNVQITATLKTVSA